MRMRDIFTGKIWSLAPPTHALYSSCGFEKIRGEGSKMSQEADERAEKPA